MPIGIGVSILKYGATGKQSGVGEITVELRVTDALTGQLVGALYDRRVGGKASEGIWDTWYNADQACNTGPRNASGLSVMQKVARTA
jgi:hypothetical protein